MPRQLAFDLPPRPALGREDFLPAPCNELALALIDDWRHWPNGKLALVGPEGSGKTHLAHVWAAQCDASSIEASDLSEADVPNLPAHVVVENVDRLFGHPEAQEALFHLHNRLASEDGRLLVTGRTPPSRWALALPDLASRMTAATLAELGPPDDVLLGAVLVKLFADRQLTPDPRLIPYLLVRMDRSFAAARAIVAELDHCGLSEGRPINRALAAEVLDSLARRAP